MCLDNFHYCARYLLASTPIYKVKPGSVKKNGKLLFPVVHFFEASLAYLKISLYFVSETCPPLKKPVCFQFSTGERQCKNFVKLLIFWLKSVQISSVPQEKPAVQNIKWDLRKSGNRVLSINARPLLSYNNNNNSWPLKLHLDSNFAASVLMNK